MAEYRPHEGLLALQPFDDMTGDYPESYALTDEQLEIDVAVSGPAAVTAVAHAAGRTGLLDAAHVRVADSAPHHAQQDFGLRRIRRIFTPAADYRKLPLTDLLREVSENTWLSDFLEMVVGMAGHDVAPDIVPDAAALWVAAWCWRNNTRGGPPPGHGRADGTYQHRRHTRHPAACQPGGRHRLGEY